MEGITDETKEWNCETAALACAELLRYTPVTHAEMCKTAKNVLLHVQVIRFNGILQAWEYYRHISSINKLGRR
jgi:hypothetical protein